MAQTSVVFSMSDINVADSTCRQDFSWCAKGRCEGENVKQRELLEQARYYTLGQAGHRLVVMHIQWVNNNPVLLIMNKL